LISPTLASASSATTIALLVVVVVPIFLCLDAMCLAADPISIKHQLPAFFETLLSLLGLHVAGVRFQVIL
jgi:hypothetical protein